MLLDTSVLVTLFRDRTGAVSRRLQELLDGRDYFLTRLTQMELLQGARNEAEWLRLSEYLADQDYLELDENSWPLAARLYYDLRRSELTVRSVVDCLIAEIALRHKVTLIHSDRDFVTIAKLRPLRHVEFEALTMPSGANLTFESRQPRTRSQMSNSKAPLES